eukprot:CAMPEP_0179152892 /NCGR_PEP_ID=MMETSP0796-20121207/74319_1 /TAXON_ID=73915 /ORGANISM="Pyrodinium bahamense, Strain pbaha01" /LENGTH=52 /DNA_ID=CAMNT_0020854127 /DNA_START=27 /DNA_END=182 /DNA_ORIENTATION=+
MAGNRLPGSAGLEVRDKGQQPQRYSSAVASLKERGGAAAMRLAARRPSTSGK